MTVYKRFSHHGFPALITSNVAARRAVFSDPANAAHLKRIMRDVKLEEGFTLYAWVIMPDHFHLVLAPHRGTTTGEIVKRIKGRFAREYNLGHGRMGSFWQSRYHLRVLVSERALWSAVEYVHQNPVAAGLVKDPRAYEWSSGLSWAARSEDAESGRNARATRSSS